MPKDIVGKLRGWQEAAGKADEFFNPPRAPQINPVEIAKRQQEILAKRTTAKRKLSRTQGRKAAFLAREAAKKRQQQLQKIKITPKQRKEILARKAMIQQMMYLTSPAAGGR